MSSTSSTTTNNNNINHEKYFSLKKQHPFAFYHFDVRSPQELVEDGLIEGFDQNLPLTPWFTDCSDEVLQLLLPENKQAHLVFSCASGNRSSKACQKVMSLGYENVYNLEGGARLWNEQVKPLYKSPFGAGPFVKCIYDDVTGTNQYVVFDLDTKHAAIVDAVMDFDNVSWSVSYANAGKIINFIDKLQLKVEFILETHAHADHLSCSQYLKEQLRTSPQIGIGAGIPRVQKTFADIFSIQKMATDGTQFDKLIETNEQFKLGSLECRALHVPGHTPDHMCYLVGDCVFTGDSIFMPDSGTARCDFPAGSAHQLYQSISKVLFSLPDPTRLFVGHDYKKGGRPAQFQTTVNEQKQSNIHVKNGISEEQFIEMRQTRDKTLGNPRLLYQSLNVNIRAGHFPEEKSTAFPERPIMRIPVLVPPGMPKRPAESAL